jgi:hypothetical protein
MGSVSCSLLAWRRRRAAVVDGFLDLAAADAHVLEHRVGKLRQMDYRHPLIVPSSQAAEGSSEKRTNKSAGVVVSGEFLACIGGCAHGLALPFSPPVSAGGSLRDAQEIGRSRRSGFADCPAVFAREWRCDLGHSRDAIYR